MQASSKFVKRWLTEIDKAKKSKLFKAFWDKDGVIDSDGAETLYLLFTPEHPHYRNQQHVLSIKFRYGRGDTVYEFPVSPPLVKFMTPICHTNVGVGGSICLDVLQEGHKGKSNGWSPMYDVEAIFASIIGLLADPNTSSPLDGVASKNYDRARAAWNREAEETKTKNEDTKAWKEYVKLLDSYYNQKMTKQHQHMIAVVAAEEINLEDAF